MNNEYRRITDRCSTREEKEKGYNHFNKVLELNDYPPEFLKNRHRHNTTSGWPRDTEFSYYSIPYISDRLNQNIIDIFNSLNIPVRTTHPSYTLRMALRKQPTDGECKWKSCLNPNKALCLKSMVVYKISCDNCHKTYIGSTVRKLHIRITEHLKRKQSAMHQHLLQCQSTRKISVEVIDRDRDPVNIRLREAIAITEHQPALNNREELNDFQHLTF